MTMVMEQTVLSDEQIAFYHENGFLHIPEVFTPEETSELSDQMDRLVEDWAFTSPGWNGPWRLAYMIRRPRPSPG